MLKPSILGVTCLLAGCASSSGLLSPKAGVASHELTSDQKSAIVAAAKPFHTGWVEPRFSPGLMKAIQLADGTVEFCAFVLTGQINIFGTENRLFFAGSFPSASSADVSMQRASSDAQGMALGQECHNKGMGIT